MISVVVVVVVVLCFDALRGSRVVYKLNDVISDVTRSMSRLTERSERMRVYRARVRATRLC